ncbi:putative zinc-binding metallopeptidase [Pedobacter sp.]|jgi:substrate import-associated zinc metallohydrolase lipoprotein|uniref:zinc-binding metallopeptidase n=1 Tax=Pedobacter sp. TaxID=1411316 RepID=UPI002CB09528|nr:putative zinc-binding metallopeptidase [Pedobacter sp.]HWW38126.1 putative zinc-binding metallopeptidase [Pedobacter sp.]
MKRQYILIILFFVASFLGCKKNENLDRNIVGLGGDTWEQTALDQWLYNNFTKPYNISVKYRWDGTEYDNSKTLTPPKFEKVQPLMEVVKSCWIDAYTAETGQDFIKRFAPKQYVLVGSLQYNSGGTVTLGEAEGGVKVTLFNVNNFDKTDRSVAKRVLKTIHHEFTHILNQTVTYQKEFAMVTPAGYTADWNNSSAFAANGFISQYAQAAPGEDYAEMVSIMLTEGKQGYEAILKANTSATAVAAIRAKEQLVVSYFKQTWGIDIYALQSRVQIALNETAPLSPLTYLGFGKNNTALTVNPDNLPGLSADFKEVFAAAKTGLALVGNAGRILDNFNILYPAANQMVLRLNYRNSAGSPLVANFTYNVTSDASGNISLALASTDGNAGVIASGVNSLTNYLTQNKFTYKWFYSSNYASEYIGLFKTADPTSFFFGVPGN